MANSWPVAMLAVIAILSFLIPTLPANGNVVIGFQNQATSNDTPLSRTAMLSSAFDFDAQMGRQLAVPFALGEISQYPQAIIGGTPVATQADIRARWPDGSVKR